MGAAAVILAVGAIMKSKPSPSILLVSALPGGAIAVLAVGLAAALFSTSAAASSLLPLPNYGITFSGVPGSQDATGNTPQSGGYSFVGGNLDVSATAGTTSQPYVDVTVTSGGCFGGSCAGGIVTATATIFYDIEVSGPSGVLVPTLFGVSGTGGGFVALIPPGGIGLTGFNTSTFPSTQSANMLSNTIYQVELRAGATVFDDIVSTATAWADPHIYIDPNYANAGQFSLQIAPGIGNSISGSATPLPAALPLFATGFGVMGFLAKRRKRKNIAAPVAA